MTWVITVWSLIGLYILLQVVTDNPWKSCKGNQTCSGLVNLAWGFAVATFAVIWFIVFLALSIAWFATRPSKICPQCWGKVNGRRTMCKRCGYDFTNAPALAAPSTTASLQGEPPFWPPPPDWKSDQTQAGEAGHAPDR
jgi:hypothetical protein